MAPGNSIRSDNAHRTFTFSLKQGKEIYLTRNKNVSIVPALGTVYSTHLITCKAAKLLNDIYHQTYTHTVQLKTVWLSFDVPPCFLMTCERCSLYDWLWALTPCVLFLFPIFAYSVSPFICTYRALQIMDVSGWFIFCHRVLFRYVCRLLREWHRTKARTKGSEIQPQTNANIQLKVFFYLLSRRIKHETIPSRFPKPRTSPKTKARGSTRAPTQQWVGSGNSPPNPYFSKNFVWFA